MTPLYNIQLEPTAVLGLVFTPQNQRDRIRLNQMSFVIHKTHHPQTWMWACIKLWHQMSMTLSTSSRLKESFWWLCIYFGQIMPPEQTFLFILCHLPLCTVLMLVHAHSPDMSVGFGHGTELELGTPAHSHFMGIGRTGELSNLKKACCKCIQKAFEIDTF